MRISDWSSDVCSSDLLSPTAALAGLACPFIVSGRVIATAPPFAAGLGVCFASDLPALSAFLVAMADSCVEPVELMSTTKEWVPDRQAKKKRGEKRGQVGAPLEESDRHTAVGNHRAAGHEAGALGKQESGILRAFFRAGHALQRMQSRNDRSEEH